MKKIENAWELPKAKREIASSEDIIKIHFWFCVNSVHLFFQQWLNMHGSYRNWKSVFLNSNDQYFPVTYLKNPCVCKIEVSLNLCGASQLCILVVSTIDTIRNYVMA